MTQYYKISVMIDNDNGLHNTIILIHMPISYHFPLLLQSLGVHLIHFASILIFLFTMECLCLSSTSGDKQMTYCPL